jgi:hypothetical protein
LTTVDDADVKSTSGEINEESGGGVNVGYSNENKMMFSCVRSTILPGTCNRFCDSLVFSSMEKEQ